MPRICAHDGCTKQPFYGHNGEYTYCAKHKLEGMKFSGTRKTCAHDGCKTAPMYGHNGEFTHCAKHKLEGMEYSGKRKTCAHDGCTKQPMYGRNGEYTHCAKHKLEGMEYSGKRKTCAHDGCTKQPMYGRNGEYTHCAKHKLEGMEYSGKRKTCAHDGCTKQPHYGHNGEFTHCAKHRLEGMEYSGTLKTCVSEWCDFYVNNDKYDGYCTHCFKNLFPDDPRTPKIKGKTKEELVRDFINKNFEGFIHDMPIIWGGCDCSMRRRVDHRKLINGTMLAIETDEGQHKSYDAKKEEHRYDDLFFAHSGHWIFIRFNPDGYKDSKGEKRGGMFNAADGKKNKLEVDRRLKVLKEEIEKQIRRIENYENTELLEIHKLFYDEELT